MPLPSVIRILYRSWTIECIDDEAADELGVDGDCKKHRAAIRIRDSLEDVVKVDTVLHEVIHAIYSEYNIKDDDGEEDTVQVVASGLTQVLHDNPKLLQWIKTTVASK